MIPPVDPGARPVVSHIVDGRGSDEAVAHELVHWRLAVQGMAASEAKDARVSVKREMDW